MPWHLNVSGVKEIVAILCSKSTTPSRPVNIGFEPGVMNNARGDDPSKAGSVKSEKSRLNRIDVEGNEVVLVAATALPLFSPVGAKDKDRDGPTLLSTPPGG